MSRIGKKAVSIPSGVSVELAQSHFKVKGPKGQLEQALPTGVSAKKEGETILFAVGESEELKPLHGLMRSLCANMIEGVTKGFSKDLEIQGVGYRAKIEGKNLSLTLGFTHPVVYPIPEGIKVEVADQVKVKVSGADKQLVGEVAARVRRFLPPEPYKGKGIRYAGEIVKKKAGKTVA